MAVDQLVEGAREGAWPAGRGAQITDQWVRADWRGGTGYSASQLFAGPAEVVGLVFDRGEDGRGTGTEPAVQAVRGEGRQGGPDGQGQGLLTSWSKEGTRLMSANQLFQAGYPVEGGASASWSRAGGSRPMTAGVLISASCSGRLAR